MELAAKRFAGWVLAVHLALLLAVVALVYSAAKQTYRASRAHAIQQASKIQMLLAEQTQRGIESYYSSICDTLELLGWTENSETPGVAFTPIARAVMAPSIWQQVRHRASHFFVYNRATGTVAASFPHDEEATIRAVVNDQRSWLASQTGRSLSPPLKVNGVDANLVAAPAPRGVLLFVAVVPVENIESQFLKGMYTARMSAMLLDSDFRVVLAFNRKLIGLSLVGEESIGNEKMKELALQYARTGLAGTEVLEQPFQLGDHEFARGMVSIRPVNILGSRVWLTVGSDLEEVESVMQATFGQSLRHGIFLVLSMTAILASTSVWLIRSRVRVERMKHDVIRRELEQARQIQLAWLPRNDQDPPNLDLCAVNTPASHISGDFYNWFDLKDGRVCVVIGDVTGHGMAAAFLMATTQLLVKIIMPRVPDAGMCLEAINNQLCQQVFSGQFVTMQILVIDQTKGKLEIATAGHPPPLIRREGRFEPIGVAPQLVLGIDKGTPYVSQTFDLPRGATILMYTDGVIEARSAGGDWLGIDRLRDGLNAMPTTAQGLANDVVAIVDRFRGALDLADDLTLVAIRVGTGDNDQQQIAKT